jgi:hypothetical protein
MGAMVLSQESGGLSLKVSIQLHPVTRSIASVGAYLLLLYAFVVWIGTNIPLPLPHFICCCLNILFDMGVQNAKIKGKTS